MRFILTLEKFTKQYQQKIDVKDFKKIKKGSKILYMGGQVEVVDNNGYVLKLKGEDGKTFTVNKNQFDHGGMIKEVNDGKKKKKKKVFHPDMMYEGIVKDLEAMGAQIDYLNDADKPTKKIWKKAGFDTDDDDMIILYSYSNDWYDVTKLLDKKRVKYKELEDPNSAGESFIVFKESVQINEGIEWQGILVKDATLKYNNKPTGGPGLEWVGQSYAKVPKGTFLIGLPGGLFAVNMKKKFAMALTTGSREWLDAQDKLKGNEVGGTNMAPEYREWKKYLNESMNEAKFVKSYNTKVNDAETEKDVKKIYPKYKKIGVGKLTHFFGELEPNLFFKARYPKYYKQDTGKSVKGDFKIVSVYSFRNGNGIELMKESINEAKDQWKEEREYIKQMADDNKSSVYKMADYVQFLGLMNQKQWEKFMYGMYKKDLQKTDTKTKNKIYKVFTKMFEGNLFELSSQQDGTKDSNGKHKHEDHVEEDIETMWKKTYGEDFVKHYPAIVKILRQRKIKDKREIARIWQDTYGEDFEKEYPALYNKL